MRKSWRVVLSFLFFGAACFTEAPTDAEEQIIIDPGDPEWRFQQIDHGQGDTTLTDVWANELGEVFVVGWYGTILTNRDGSWDTMEVPTTENLTAIVGLNNGGRFGLDPQRGEMVAVGWNGTLLYYHPDPNGDEDPADGAWSKVAGPGEAPSTVGQPQYFSSVLKIDPSCPDFDGDGIPDDGNGDGWWGDLGAVVSRCNPSLTSGCDDNCRTTPNGIERPLLDTNNVGIEAGCLGPGDLPDVANAQRDDDGDGIGLVCDGDDDRVDESGVFTSSLFDVWADFNGDTLRILAVGESGALLSYRGESNSIDTPTQVFSLADPRAWVAQDGIPFRFSTDDDCGSDPALGGCEGRLFPSCPAQCNPVKTTCDCLPGQGQCCDASASTGAGCVDGSCGPVANACAANGLCTALCPDCFRRMGETLASIDVSNDEALAVGAKGTIVRLSVATDGSFEPFFDVWSAPSCATPDPPLDENPKLTAVSGANGEFVAVGAAGAVFRINGAENCPARSISGVPLAFVTAVEASRAQLAYGVGDNGLFMEIRSDEARTIATKVSENFLGIERTRFTVGEGDDQQQVERFWLVGANGRVVLAGFF